MAPRKFPLEKENIYHIYSKSIAGFEIFRNSSEYTRMRELLRFYRIKKPPLKFSAFIELQERGNFFKKYFMIKETLIEIIAYCLMPTHLHLILKQLKEKGISIFMNNILNSYTRYFNLKTKRKGPLWESRFKNVWIETDEQLLHLTRYLHLNPVTARLVDKPQDWKFSSYNEYIDEIEDAKQICNYSDLLTIKPETYKEFVNSQIDYQRELAEIKKLFLE